VSSISIPDKETFKIGEVAKLLELEPYVLRYWETEFEQLAPEKTRSGQRVYKRADIEQLIKIRELLYTELFTIAGARRQLEFQDAGLVDNHAELELELESTLSLNAALQSDVDRLTDRVDQLELEAKEQQLTLTERARELDAAIAQRNALIARADELEGELAAKISELDERGEPSTDVDDHWGLMTDQLGEDVARLEREVEEYRSQVLELVAHRDQLEQYNDELEARLRAQSRDRREVFDVLHQELTGLRQLALA